MWIGSVSNMSRKTQAKRQSSVKPTNVNPNRVTPTTVKPTTVKPIKVKPTNVNPLRTVPFEKGFHFYTNLGNYTGITATNLSEFAAKLQIVPSESVIFHSHAKFLPVLATLLHSICRYCQTLFSIYYYLVTFLLKLQNF